MRQSALLALILLSLTACGRNNVNSLYQAYQYAPAQMRNAEGEVMPDLRTQNRLSLNNGGGYSYRYTNPNETPAEDTEAPAATSQAEATQPASPVATSSSASTTPASARPAAASHDPLAAAKESLSELASALEVLIRKSEQN